jgi:hypothetical protein
MRLVAEQRTLEHVADRGGAVYVWPHGLRCCAGRSYVLDASTSRPRGAEFLPLHEEGGVSIWATPGLLEPEEIHLELDRRGRVQAFWNGQAWIG